jgi:hypothetical protein
VLPGTVWVGIRAYSVYVGRLPASVGFVLRIFPGNIEKSGVYDDEDLQACSCSRQAQWPSAILGLLLKTSKWAPTPTTLD